MFRIIILVVIGSVCRLIALGYSLIYKSSGLAGFVQGDNNDLQRRVPGLHLLRGSQNFVFHFAFMVILMFLLGFGIEKGVIHRLVKGVNPSTPCGDHRHLCIIRTAPWFCSGPGHQYFTPVTSVKSIRLFSVQTEAALYHSLHHFMILFSFFANEQDQPRNGPEGCHHGSHGGQGSESAWASPRTFPWAMPPVSRALPGC